VNYQAYYARAIVLISLGSIYHIPHRNKLIVIVDNTRYNLNYNIFQHALARRHIEYVGEENGAFKYALTSTGKSLAAVLRGIHYS